MLKIWIDDIRKPPNSGYFWIKSVNEAKSFIVDQELMYNVSGKKEYYRIDLIDIDHDAGIYNADGGDYINLLNWFEETGRRYPIRIHSMNPVGVCNMRRIIRRNGWEEI